MSNSDITYVVGGGATLIAACIGAGALLITSRINTLFQGHEWFIEQLRADRDEAVRRVERLRSELESRDKRIYNLEQELLKRQET